MIGVELVRCWYAETASPNYWQQLLSSFARANTDQVHDVDDIRDMSKWARQRAEHFILFTKQVFFRVPDIVSRPKTLFSLYFPG